MVPGNVKAAMVLLLCHPALVLAQTDVHPFLADKFYVQAGAFFPQIDFGASVDGSIDDSNPEWDFSEQFGLSQEHQVGAAEFIWRYGERWSLRMQYFSVDQTDTATLQRDVEWGDVTFLAGTNISVGTGVDILRVFTGRNFSNSPKFDYGVGFGLHRFGAGIGLAGEILVEDEIVASGNRKVGTTAPLPNIGAWYAWSPNAKWAFAARLDWMEASIGDYGGRLINASFGTSYQMFRNVGIGLNYQSFSVDLDIDKQFWHGGLNLKYEGMYLYLTANWDN
jgi:hypothetical protein